MRVVVMNRDPESGFWKPEGDFTVIAETPTKYKIKRKKKLKWFGPEVDVSQWVPKDGPYTHCEKVLGWWV